MKKVLSVLIVCILLSLCAYPVCAISASAAAVINGDTGDLLYSHNSDVRLPMASTTKIMTALLLAENCKDLDGEIVTTKEMVTVEGSSMGLLEGDRVSFRALLYGMMLSSGNDAANTAAIAIGGSIEGFVELMNNKAVDLGLSNTHFVTPSGLDAEGHYTTAYDLARLAGEALKNPDFAEAAAAKSATLYYGNPPYRRTLSNHNKLLNMYDDIVGVKTGFTKKSGRCLVSAAKRDGRFVIAVTLNDGDDWADHRFLLDVGLSSIEVHQYSAQASKLDIPLISGVNNTLNTSASDAQFSILKSQEVYSVICAPHFLYAPVGKGEIVGNVEYYCSDRLIYKSNIISSGGKAEKHSKSRLIFVCFKYMFSLV